MWSIIFTMAFGGMLISAMTEEIGIWFFIFIILMIVCTIAQTTTEIKQDAKIKSIEKQLKELQEKTK